MPAAVLGPAALLSAISSRYPGRSVSPHGDPLPEHVLGLRADDRGLSPGPGYPPLSRHECGVEMHPGCDTQPPRA